MWRPWAGRAMNFTILILLIIEVLHTKNGNNMPCSFKVEVKIVNAQCKDQLQKVT